MSDAPREPLEPELLPRPADGLSTFSPNDPDFDERRHLSAPPRPPKRKPALVLFLLTCVTTFYAGVEQFPRPKIVVDPASGNQIVQLRIDPNTRRATPMIDWPLTIQNGLIYAGGLMLILGAHEMGHYLQAMRYGVPASLPMFIPMPIGPVGTMGAVIIQQAGVADRKSMFDIAISGPLAGLVIALPLSWWGIKHAQLLTVPPGTTMHGYGDPLILKWIVRYYFGPLQANQDVVINPVLFAGWVGVFITAFNLMPIGQFDGGHILYCLIRRKSYIVAGLMFFAAVLYSVDSLWPFFKEQAFSGWILALALGFRVLILTFIWKMGIRHPPTADDDVPLGPGRIVLGWLALLFIFIGFTPRPFF